MEDTQGIIHIPTTIRVNNNFIHNKITNRTTDIPNKQMARVMPITQATLNNQFTQTQDTRMKAQIKTGKTKTSTGKIRTKTCNTKTRTGKIRTRTSITGKTRASRKQANLRDTVIKLKIRKPIRQIHKLTKINTGISTKLIKDMYLKSLWSSRELLKNINPQAQLTHHQRQKKKKLLRKNHSLLN